MFYHNSIRPEFIRFAKRAKYLECHGHPCGAKPSTGRLNQSPGINDHIIRPRLLRNITTNDENQNTMDNHQDYFLQAILLAVITAMLVIKVGLDFFYCHITSAIVTAIFAVVAMCLTAAAYDEYKNNKL